MEGRPCARSPSTTETLEVSSLSKRDLVILNASSLFRRSPLRGRPFTIPGRGRLRRLLELRLFIDLAIRLGPLRRFGTLPQELDVAGVNFQADALNALAIGVLFAP